LGKHLKQLSRLESFYDDSGRKAKGKRSGIRAQLQERIVFLNDAGAKTRLLNAKIGQNSRAKEEGDPTIWEAMLELNTKFKIIKTEMASILKTMTDSHNILTKFGVDIHRMDINMIKMYKHYKSHLGSSNMRLVTMEKDLSIADWREGSSTSPRVVERNIHQPLEMTTNLLIATSCRSSRSKLF
jgi:hypothetical protein